MLAFRSLPPRDQRHPVPEDVTPLLSRLWQPCHFHLGNGLRAAWQFEAEGTLPWETFRGRLLDPRQTRVQRSFRTWNLLPVLDGRISDEPLLSLLLDQAEPCVHITRGLLCHVWEAHDSPEGLESRETTRWVRELIGTARLKDFCTQEELKDEIVSLIWQALVGTSRLPLTSIEAPLPAFLLGQLAYVPKPATATAVPSRPRRIGIELFATGAADVSPRERIKMLEATLRSISNDEIAATATRLAAWVPPLGTPSKAIPALVRGLFNDVSLSPYTGLVDRALDLLAELQRQEILGPADVIDTIGFLLRQLVRHLTAYDLVLFHYRGANYPDALFLDALLRRYLALARSHPASFLEGTPAAARRRRALRQGCLVRRRYEGHAVPDQPTSPGENARVLPAPLGRVPEEQILQPQRRQRLLYTDAPLTDLVDDALRPLIEQAGRDLDLAEEQRELGMALFIERPLGFRKAPAEVDQTPLVSYELFSRRLAVQRLREWERLAAELTGAGVTIEPAELDFAGVPVERVPDSARPAVALADARKVSEDFRVLRTTCSSARAFWDLFDTSALPWPDPAAALPLFLRVRLEDGSTPLQAFDAAGLACLEFDADVTRGSSTRAGLELPRAGLISSRGPLPLR